MATGATIKIDGVATDLDAIFEPRGATVARPSLSMPFLGADITLRYRASAGSYDQWSAASWPAVEPMVAGQPLRTYFRKLGWTPPAPTITSCYNDGPEYEGDLIRLFVTFTGYEVERVVWRSPSGTVLQDSADPSYYLFSTSHTQTGTYSAEVFNAGGSATGTTDVTVLELVDPPTCSVTSDSPRYVGQDVHLVATAADYDTLEWIDPLGVVVTGETGLTYTFPATTIDQSGTYKCRATNSGGHTDGSTTVTIYDDPAPTIGAFSVAPDPAHWLDTVTFTLTASDAGGNLASYVITHDDGTTTHTAASGSLGGGGPTTVHPTYEIPATTATNGTGGTFYVTVTDSLGYTDTDSATIAIMT